jgi:hypothetical protein
MLLFAATPSPLACASLSPLPAQVSRRIYFRLHLIYTGFTPDLHLICTVRVLVTTARPDSLGRYTYQKQRLKVLMSR